VVLLVSWPGPGREPRTKGVPRRPELWRPPGPGGSAPDPIRTWRNRSWPGAAPAVVW